MVLFSCTTNNSSLKSLVNQEVEISDLIQSIQKPNMKIPKETVLFVEFDYIKSTKKCLILSVKTKQPSFFLIEGKSNSTSMKIECEKKDKKTLWKKVCDDKKVCAKHFCDCLISTDCDDKCRRILMYSKRSNTLYLNI